MDHQAVLSVCTASPGTTPRTSTALMGTALSVSKLSMTMVKPAGTQACARVTNHWTTQNLPAHPTAVGRVTGSRFDPRWSLVVISTCAMRITGFGTSPAASPPVTRVLEKQPFNGGNRPGAEVRVPAMQRRSTTEIRRLVPREPTIAAGARWSGPPPHAQASEAGISVEPSVQPADGPSGGDPSPLQAQNVLVPTPRSGRPYSPRLQIRGDDDRRHARWKSDCDIVALVGSRSRPPGSSLVPGTPLRKETGAQPIGTAAGVLHPQEVSASHFSTLRSLFSERAAP